MRIAFIVHQFPSTSETFILNQITGFLERGHEVEIFAGAKSNDEVIHRDVAKYRLLERTYYRTLPKSLLERYADGWRGIAHGFHRHPWKTLRLLNPRLGRPALTLSAWFHGRPFMARAPFHILLCHFGVNGKIAAMLRKAGVVNGKVVTFFHGTDLSSYIKKHGEQAYRGLFKSGDMFLPISEHWRKELIRLGCPAEKTLVHRMGIDPFRFAFRPRFPAGERVRLLSVARLVEKKGIEFGIRAVARLATRHPKMTYTIVGDGPLRPQLEELITELRVTSNVRLIGWREQEEIIRLMQGADILLAPSVQAANGDQEGIPVVIMEAMAQGLPVLTTRHSGIPELVQDGLSGFLAPERDVETLASKLDFLLNFQELWVSMGEAGRRRIEAQHDIERLNDRLELLCCDLVEEKTLEPSLLVNLRQLSGGLVPVQQ